MFGVAEPDPEALAATWAELETTAADVGAALAHWRARALRAEAEAAEWRRRYEASSSTDTAATLARLEEENRALRERILEARARVQRLLARLQALERP